MKILYGLNFGAIHRKQLSELRKREKNKGHEGHRKVKCELSQGLVIINLHMQNMCIPVT